MLRRIYFRAPITIWVAVFAAAMLVRSSYAASQSFSDGRSHVITWTVFGNIEVRNDTQVTVPFDGVINAPSSAQDATAVQVLDTSTFALTGGRISGPTSGPGNATGIAANDQAKIVITSGELWAVTSEPGFSFGVILNGNSTLDMSGGSIRAITNAEQANGITANDNARVRISGGEIYASGFGSPTDYHLVANDTSRITIAGHGFNHPMGVPITDLSGDISGTFANGGDISYFFRRSPTASILLVPEPGAAALVLGLLVFSAVARRTTRIR